MRRGVTDPSSKDFNNPADWYAEGDVLEIRIPWMLLGFTDPRSLRVCNYPYETGKLEPAMVEGIRVYPAVRAAGEIGQKEIEPLDYGWDDPTFYERKKKSFGILGEAFEDKELGQPSARRERAPTGEEPRER